MDVEADSSSSLKFDAQRKRASRSVGEARRPILRETARIVFEAKRRAWLERKEQANRESGGGKEGSAKRDRERSGARGQRGRIIRPQNPEAFNIIRYRVSSIGCRGRRERKRGRPGWRVKERPAERERERENRREGG